MKWKTEKRRIDELIPNEHNPRIMTEDQAKSLEASIKKFDLVEIPAINKDGTLLAGHQRLKVMQMIGRGQEKIDVRVPDRQLTPEEAKEYNIRSNADGGEWNFDTLADEFEMDDLRGWGFSDKELIQGFDLDDGEDDIPPEKKPPEEYCCPNCAHTGARKEFKS